MKKNVLFIIVLLLILCGCKNTKTNKEKEIIKIDNYNIVFSYNYDQYNIETKDNKIYVTKYNIVQCVKAPCNPIKDKTYEVELNKEYKEFIENLFKDKNDNTITIYKDMLDNNQIKILSNILNIDIPKNDILFKVNKTDEYNTKYKNKGYYINKQSDDKILITIALGTKNTGGYSVELDRIYTDNKGTTYIYVKEISPNNGDVVTQAFTYPTIELELNKMPTNIKVINNTTHEVYNELKN